MSIWDGFLDRLANGIAARLISDRNQPIATARDYRLGVQPRQLRVLPGQFDDNITVNFIGLIVNRIVSQLIGKGISFDWEDTSKDEKGNAVKSETDLWLEGMWDANHQEILLHLAILGAAEAGTGYLEIRPEEQIGEDGLAYPRLVDLEAGFMTINTLPEDVSVVTSYVMEYKFAGDDNKEHSRRKITERTPDGGSWQITSFISDNGGKWVQENPPVLWPYPFAPIIHWQNLPKKGSATGQPDITDDLERLQDRVNFLQSNISKIIRYYAHPQRYSKMGGERNVIQVGPAEIPNFNSPDGGMFQLETMGDLAGALSYLTQLRQAMFDIARVVDIDSLQDKLGALTNFGIRVIYQDNLNMIASHREMLGDALEEINRRCAILAGKQPVDCDVNWPDFMPTSEAEDSQAITTDLDNGLVSKETAASLRGYDWKKEQERIAKEGQAASANSNNLGGQILNNWRMGGFQTGALETAMMSQQPTGENAG